MWRWMRMLRCFKLLKWPQLFKMTNRGNMDPEYVGFYFWTVPVMQGFFKLAFLLHMLTLGRMLVSPVLSDDECHAFGKDACADSPTAEYGYAAYWLWALLTTQGQASLESPIVYVYAAIMLMLSLLLQGYVVADMSALVIKSNVTEQINDSMRSTLAIMEHYSMPQSLQQEVLSFQYHSLQQNAASGLANTLQRLPQQMQREVGLYVKVDLVTNVPMFKELSGDCRLAVANCLEQSFAEPQDFIIRFGTEGNEMFFMMHGFADVIVPMPGTEPEQHLQKGEQGNIVATIRRGDYFGEVALLMNENKRTASIQALTYCNLFRLHRQDFTQLYAQFDELNHRMTAEARRRELMAMATLDDEEVAVPMTSLSPTAESITGSAGVPPPILELESPRKNSKRTSRVVGLKPGIIYSGPRKSLLGTGDDSAIREARRPSNRRVSMRNIPPPQHFINNSESTAQLLFRTSDKTSTNNDSGSDELDKDETDFPPGWSPSAVKALKDLEQQMVQNIDKREERMEQLVGDEARALSQRLNTIEMIVRQHLTAIEESHRGGKLGFGGLLAGERYDGDVFRHADAASMLRRAH